MTKCKCNYPSTKSDNTWTGHAPTCPIEVAARNDANQRFKRKPNTPPDGLPKRIRKLLKGHTQ